MEANYILVRFGELTTKGKNRKLFTRKLLKNTQEILSDFKKLKYDLQYDRMYILLNGENHLDVNEKLKTVFGIHSFSNAFKFEKDLNVVKDAIVQLVNEDNKTTFKINTKRSDKSFPGKSQDINREIAGHLFHHANRQLKVDVHHPEMLITVEIRHDAIYVMTDVIKGAGGYPVGIGGKALLMLSGGIDSPVAGYLTLKRGVDIECIHFAAPPYTNEFAREKMLDLVDQLRHYTHGKITVHIVNFTKLQLAVYDHCDESYAMTVMRRMMYRIGEKVALKNHCLALVNGESIGQVASQTLNSMQVINEVIKLPVLRPVLCLDKLEIIDIANKINTYDISIRPHEDCCTIFTPKAPATKPKSYKAEAFEATFDYESLVDECVDTVETIVIDNQYKNNELIF
ncbi:MULTISPECIES: tRNA uracil 4-sulfurtransferase ThiI [Coprobacillaceae]|uniref:tRNA uracil 4-sulfurtransferase ThiI n=1 Tax=Coprobacillaceae TaxID=2810280 RepID=UPI000E491E5C|nr:MULTISPECIES: tRNA uracil 4-sulfurtransferase ThiI [Coprobacillaceae]RHM62576.1 tRNA 4-thiouridine(8) synthase ThiI [Coprobacillus sp. AF33-1AC]RHS93394.1 tRNA 4-thiouridine(8) synthase ThiI [Erysipelatoclostridium sp. AM42-17]